MTQRLRVLAFDLLLIIVGSLLYAVSTVVFSAPNHIAPGGVTGVAILTQYAWSLPIGTVTIALNIPLILAGWRRLGRRFLIRTGAGLLLSSVFTDLLDTLLPAYQGDRLLVCLFGGAICGLGLGLILMRGGTTGGSEIAGRLLELRFPHVPIGKLVLAVDGVVIAVSGVVYKQLDSVLYGVLFAFVSSLVTDWLIYGGRRGKMALILTDRQEEVTALITQELERGVTLLPAVGGYTGTQRQMILCAVRREEVHALKRMVFRLDKQAFFITVPTDEVHGAGWLPPQE
ncbi:MAG: YitT family protein [Ruminococcaceae bacterium]|nr:YitT family protein [Oscillospiraceae bacterium]